MSRYIDRMNVREVNLFDSILAILGGYGAMFIVSKTFLTIVTVAAPIAAEGASKLPDTNYLLVILCITWIAAVVGGIVSCLIAKRDPIKHTVALSAVAMILGIITTATNPIAQPLWYSFALVGLSVLGIVLVGLFLQLRNRSKESLP